MTQPTPRDMRALINAGSEHDLDALARGLASIGEAARADDQHGPRWSRWADWCWRQARCPFPADTSTGAEFIADEIGSLQSTHDADELLAVLDGVARRHLDAGHPNPFDSSQPIATDDDLGVALLGEALDDWTDRGLRVPLGEPR